MTELSAKYGPVYKEKIGPLTHVVISDPLEYVKRIPTILTPEGFLPNLELELFKWAFESIGTFLFEERIGCLDHTPTRDADEFLKHLIGFFKYMQPLMYNLPIYKFYPTPTWRKYEYHADKVIENGMKFINKKVAELRAAGPDIFEGETVSLLTHFLSLDNVTIEDVNSHTLDIMMGGVETTSNATLWTLYMLAKTPSAQQTLYNQLAQVVPNKADVTAENLAHLPYLKGCLKEAFRFVHIDNHSLIEF
ncbi:hypothetical protein LSH36_401g00071 [Paralvinella palmiformis]|uniref:Cytochrome P450 n=1 Tax=Paralvinella palmiformis TaxID=53620 RepID=A0AAD9MYI8_9ANNE|nr:hypothetical protein LSH36_401g00071 [Paralvinella palmiformis]